MDIQTYLLTKNNLIGPLYLPEEPKIEPMRPITDADGNITRGSAIGQAIAYVLMAGFIATLFLAF